MVQIEHFRPGQAFFEHGPITMVIGGWRQGEPMRKELDEAAAIAARHLEELSHVPERGKLPLLGINGHGDPAVASRRLPLVFRQMCRAVKATGDSTLTPMAAVAGAIADLAAEALLRRGATKAFVNNGGDMAVRVGPGEKLLVGIVASLSSGKITHILTLTNGEGIGGVATSGLGGRGFTKGVADAAVVLAENAGLADACATLLANSTFVNTPQVQQARAETLDPLTDLKGRMVTQAVHTLPGGVVLQALKQGSESARQLIEKEVIKGALIFVQGQMAAIPGPFPNLRSI